MWELSSDGVTHYLFDKNVIAILLVTCQHISRVDIPTYFKDAWILKMHQIVSSSQVVWVQTCK